jgi:hypothetical protein
VNVNRRCGGPARRLPKRKRATHPGGPFSFLKRLFHEVLLDEPDHQRGQHTDEDGDQDQDQAESGSGKTDQAGHDRDEQTKEIQPLAQVFHLVPSFFGLGL